MPPTVAQYPAFPHWPILPKTPSQTHTRTSFPWSPGGLLASGPTLSFVRGPFSFRALLLLPAAIPLFLWPQSRPLALHIGACTKAGFPHSPTNRLSSRSHVASGNTDHGCQVHNHNLTGPKLSKDFAVASSTSSLSSDFVKTCNNFTSPVKGLRCRPSHHATVPPTTTKMHARTSSVE